MHSPRSLIRGRDPHPPSVGGRGGRHRHRSPPAPPSPRYQRRPQRRNTPPPRRGDDPHPDVSAPAHHRILLEVGRLAAHYLVAQGVIPEHVLRAKEDPPAPTPRPAPPPASRVRKLDDGGGSGGDPRPRRNHGDWARAWVDDDRQARKSTRWDRRSHSFDERRMYHDAGHHDVDRGGRRTRDYDEPRRPSMSRSYSYNDCRPSANGGRVDPRSRSRSRSRTRSYYAGSGSSRDLDHTKVPDSGIIPPAAGGDCDVHYGHVDEMPRHQRRVPSSVVVAEVNDSADQEMAIEDGEMEPKIHGLLNRTRDISEGEDGEFEPEICEGEDGEFAAARLNGVEMDHTHSQLSDSDTNVHPLESVEEPTVHRGAQLSNAVEDREVFNAPTAMDACTRETLGEDNDCSQARDGMVAPHPQSEGEAGIGNFINRDKTELPSSCRVFDLNVVETPDAYEMTEISGDPQADHVSDPVPDLVGRIHKQTNCHASEIQDQDEHARGSHMLKNGHGLIRYDLNSEAVDDAQDIHLLENEKLLLSHGIDAHDTSRIQQSNWHLHLNQNADELKHENYWMENHTVIGEQLLLSDGMDGHPVSNYQMASEPKRSPMGVYDLHSYNLKSEKTMLLNDGVDKHAHDSSHLKDGQMILNQSVNRQARVHNKANERTIPVINLEDDDYEEQSDIREFLQSNILQRQTQDPQILLDLDHDLLFASYGIPYSLYSCSYQCLGVGPAIL